MLAVCSANKSMVFSFSFSPVTSLKFSLIDSPISFGSIGFGSTRWYWGGLGVTKVGSSPSSLSSYCTTPSGHTIDVSKSLAALVPALDSSLRLSLSKSGFL